MSPVDLISKLKSRVAKYLYSRTMTLNYGITLCNKDYSDEQLQDDLLHIELLSSGRSCRDIRFKQPCHLPSYPAFPPPSDSLSPLIFPGAGFPCNLLTNR